MSRSRQPWPRQKLARTLGARLLSGPIRFVSSQSALGESLEGCRTQAGWIAHSLAGKLNGAEAAGRGHLTS